MTTRVWLLATLSLLGCNTLPVGYDALGRYPGTEEVLLRPDSVASYGRYVPLGDCDRLYIGSDGDYRTRAFIRFELPDTLTLDSVLSISLILHPVDTMRTDSFRFVCVPCSSDWDEANLTWILRKAEDQWFNRGGDFRPETVALAAIGGDSIVFNLSYTARDSASRAAIRNNGLALLPASPADSGFVAVWSSEASTAYQPRTKVTYRSDSTIRYFGAADDASIFDTTPGALRPRELLVGSGFVHRTWLRFNLSALPREATIAAAELVFAPTMQYRRVDSARLGIRRLTERVTSRGLNPQSAGATAVAYYPISDGDSSVRFDIHSLVQFWTTNRDSASDSTGTPVWRDTANYGLVITPEPNWSPLFRLRVPDPRVDTLRGPRLRVRYVLPPDDRFEGPFR